MPSLKPAVPRYWLIVIAGLLWSSVGIILCQLSYTWLRTVPWSWSVSSGAAGVLLALAAYRFIFSGIANKNIQRLCLLSEKSCVFAFQAWKSYMLIALMVTLGFFVRHSSLPKHYLAIVYITMGGALFMGSFHYYARLWRIVILKETRLLSGEPVTEKQYPRK